MQLNAQACHEDDEERSTRMVRTINRIAIALTICLWASPGQAQDLSTLPKPLAEKIDAATKACADFENGQFALEWGAVSRVDLDGDMTMPLPVRLRPRSTVAPVVVSPTSLSAIQ
jgi:hypothetical protein